MLSFKRETELGRPLGKPMAFICQEPLNNVVDGGSTLPSVPRVGRGSAVPGFFKNYNSATWFLVRSDLIRSDCSSGGPAAAQADPGPLVELLNYPIGGY